MNYNFDEIINRNGTDSVKSIGTIETFERETICFG